MLHRGTLICDYQTLFEKLANRTYTLDEPSLSCFFGGSKDEIKHDIEMFNPNSLTMAMGLAHLQEDKLAAICSNNDQSLIDRCP